jgi:hypothetical protein
MRHLVFLGVALLVLGTGALAQKGPDYSDYAAALKHVNDRGMVNYRALKADPAGLNSFLDRIERVTKAEYDSWTTRDRIAFWINAYNGITLKTIIEHYPIQSGGWLSGLRFPKNSIRQIDGAWDKLTHTVMGQPMTLDEIEHGTLRKRFDEPRIHMALVCAAMGCPPLRNEPYVGEKIEEQFADQTWKFVADSSKFRIDEKTGIVYLSSIFKWFGDDFDPRFSPLGEFRGHSDAERAVLNYLSQYLPEVRAKWLTHADYKIKYLDYDWSLNEQ